MPSRAKVQAGSKNCDYQTTPKVKAKAYKEEMLIVKYKGVDSREIPSL